MGIYNSGSIFGLRIYDFNDEDCINVLFEKKYYEIMTHEQMREAYLFYNLLNNKNDVFFKIYTECSSTLNNYNNLNYMDWHPITLNMFLTQFGC